jgi:hypothetical protein
MSSELEKIHTARARLAASAARIGQSAENEGRSHYTPQEEQKLNGIFAEWCRTLEQEKESRG